jgi:asparagine synthetase B (glutamine-hydrolysing)
MNEGDMALRFLAVCLTTPAGRVETRPSVSWRERTLKYGVALYLSLYADEIDARAARFWDVLETRSPEEAAVDLELTDAVISFAAADEIWLARGAAATFPLYWQKEAHSVFFTTRLPIDTGIFSRSGLVAAAAAACLHSSYEPNGFVETPLSEWYRVRRAAFMRFRDGVPKMERVIVAPDTATPISRYSVAEEIRAAFECYRETQEHVRISLLELSGGFDSTLAAAATPPHAMRGVSVAFPFYEFRFESGVQQAVAEALSIPRVEIDGTDLFPYTPSEIPPRFDEPSVFVTGIRHSEMIARHAAELGAERIYMGHGGDQCFASDLTAREALVSNPPSKGPFTRAAWRNVKQAMEDIRSSPFTDRRAGTFVYDARQDVWVKETFGLTIRTPFSDLRIFRSAQAWSRYCAAQGLQPDKSILVEALPSLLPPSVVNRKGKVAYDGVWMRAYKQQAEHISGLFDRTSAVLEHIGVSPGWLINRVRALSAWRDCSDREVLALYAISVWLESWGIARPDDVQWGE